MSAGLLLVLVVVTAYLATHVAQEWLARRLLIVSGAEYLLLGLLLGPELSGLFRAEVVRGFAPLTALALGWVGVLVGMQFRLRALVRVPARVYRLGFGVALATGSAVTAAALAIIVPLFAVPREAALGAALALGAIATTSTPAGIEIAARALGRRGPVVQQLTYATAIDALVAIVALGLLACWLHPPAGVEVTDVGRAPALPAGVAPWPGVHRSWAVIALAIGAIGGTLFHLFLGGERKADRLFVGLAGSVILAAGTATYLGLSPLLASLVVGVILVNTARAPEEIARVLAAGERPLYFVLLIFAAASWRPSAQSAWLTPVVAYLVVRAGAKILGARALTWWNDAREELGRDWGRALVGQGGLAIALAFDYLLRGDGSPLANLVFTAAIASVLLTEFAAARLVRSVLEPLVAPLVEPVVSGAARAGSRVARGAVQAAHVVHAVHDAVSGVVHPAPEARGAPSARDDVPPRGEARQRAEAPPRRAPGAD